MAADKEGIPGAKPAASTTFFKGLQGNTLHRGAIQATMPMQLEAVLAKRERAEREHMPARPPNVFVDGVYVRGSADPKQKPLLRHVIVKDLNKVATQLKYEVPTSGLFEKKPPMGLYCIFDGVAGGGTSGTGPSVASIAEFCALNFHIALLNALSELRPNYVTAKLVEEALASSLETLDQELLIRNPEVVEGCGAAIALLVRDHLFVALMGRCSAVLCEVGDDGRRIPMTLGRGVKTGCMGGPSATSPDVLTAQLSAADRHSFLVLTSSVISNSISSTELMNISLGYDLQPRAFCGDVASRAAQAGPCTAVQVNFLPEAPTQVEAVPPPTKKAKVAHTSGATQSMRLRHILVKFHEGPKVPEEPKAKWASRSRLDAEKILRVAIAEIRQDRKQWKKPPKDVTEMISLSSKKFIELARKHSDCETAQKGALACGDLGWVTPEARASMSEHFKEVCDVLHPGQWSDIVASHQGMHLVQRVPVGTRLYGLMPAARYQVQTVGGTIPGKTGEPSHVELSMEDVPFNLRRFQEMEVISDELEPHLEDWIISTKEIYTMAYYMDEQLLVDTGMINCVIISCASAKTALALAFCLRMREMRYVFGLTSKDHLEFARSTDLFHEVFSYDDIESLPNNHTVVYMDFKCDGELRQQITLRMGTNLMYNMVIGPAVFQKKMKDQLFEKRAREVLFDESSWRERRRLVAEVTKTGRNEKLKHSYKAFIERMKQYITVKHVGSVDGFVKMYDALYSN
ncbi:unnamed protein product, partial [Cladocopium goreaui]